MAEVRKSTELHVLVRSPISNRIVTLENTDQTAGDLKRNLFGTKICDSLLLSLNGRALHDGDAIWRSVAEIRAAMPTVTVHVKALGGGGDGGATGAESRDCYLKMYAEKKPDKVDPNEQRLSKWTTCALSAEPLKPPCVVDRLGNVFNKEALVKALLGKTLPKAFRHIKGLKDMIPVHLQGGDDIVVGGDGSRFQCPITGLEFNGKYKFLALAKCGHIVSAKALKEIKSSACLVCHTEFQDTDKIAINGTDDEVAVLRERMEAENAKKVSKKKKPKAEDVTAAVSVSGKKHGIVSDNGAKVNVKKFKAVDIAPPNANKEVFASIFTSSSKSNFKETYSCRSLPLGRN